MYITILTLLLLLGVYYNFQGMLYYYNNRKKKIAPLMRDHLNYSKPNLPMARYHK